MENRYTNSDRILQNVLNDTSLMEFGEYNAADYQNIDQALNSENSIVVAVAKIINGLRYNHSEREIYNEVSNFLKSNLL